MTLQQAIGSTSMETVIGSRSMMRLRADGVEASVTVELGMPQEHALDNGKSVWTCSVRINIIPNVLNAMGQSSLDAIIAATYLAGQILSKHPNGPEIDMSLVPNFGLPLNPITTTPEALSHEQNRPKALRMPTMLQDATLSESVSSVGG